VEFYLFSHLGSVTDLGCLKNKIGQRLCSDRDQGLIKFRTYLFSFVNYIESAIFRCMEGRSKEVVILSNFRDVLQFFQNVNYIDIDRDGVYRNLSPRCC
jgi:hypothetical protein